MDNEMIATGVASILRLAGVPATVAAVVGRTVPLVVEWVRVAVSGGRDPEAELKAMLDTAEAQADELARAKFGA